MHPLVLLSLIVFFFLLHEVVQEKVAVGHLVYDSGCPKDLLVNCLLFPVYAQIFVREGLHGEFLNTCLETIRFIARKFSRILPNASFNESCLARYVLCRQIACFSLFSAIIEAEGLQAILTGVRNKLQFRVMAYNVRLTRSAARRHTSVVTHDDDALSSCPIRCAAFLREGRCFRP